MITKFKIYEEINLNEPEIGDYVIAKFSRADDDHPLNLFVTKNIGLITDKTYYQQRIQYTVKFDDIPKELYFYSTNHSTLRFYRQDLLQCSKNKEDLEKILIANKFNI